MAEGFRGVIGLLDRIGVYDIVLPFLLVFTIMFAILEKTKIFGIDKIDKEEVSKKNINAMVAIIVAFIVVASTQLVSVINQVLAHTLLLLILAVCFLLLVGVFHSDQQFSLEKSPWIKYLMILMFIGIVAIFLNALGWLQEALYVLENFDQDWAATIIFLVLIIGFMFYVTWERKPDKKMKEE